MDWFTPLAEAISGQSEAETIVNAMKILFNRSMPWIIGLMMAQTFLLILLTWQLDRIFKKIERAEWYNQTIQSLSANS